MDIYIDCFHILATINSAAKSIGMPVSLQTSVVVFSWYISSSGIARSYGSSVCNCLRNLHTVLHVECTNLLFHQQCTRVPFSLHHPQHLFFLVFLMMVILSSVRWYFFGVLICICLIIKNTEPLSMCLLAMCVFFGEMCIRCFDHFFYWIVFFVVVVCRFSFN